MGSSLELARALATAGRPAQRRASSHVARAAGPGAAPDSEGRPAGGDGRDLDRAIPAEAYVKLGFLLGQTPAEARTNLEERRAKSSGRTAASQAAAALAAAQAALPPEPSYRDLEKLIDGPVRGAKGNSTSAAAAPVRPQRPEGMRPMAPSAAPQQPAERPPPTYDDLQRLMSKRGFEGKTPGLPAASAAAPEAARGPAAPALKRPAGAPLKPELPAPAVLSKPAPLPPPPPPPLSAPPQLPPKPMPAAKPVPPAALPAPPPPPSYVDYAKSAAPMSAVRPELLKEAMLQPTARPVARPALPPAAAVSSTTAQPKIPAPMTAAASAITKAGLPAPSRETRKASDSRPLAAKPAAEPAGVAAVPLAVAAMSAPPIAPPALSPLPLSAPARPARAKYAQPTPTYGEAPILAQRPPFEPREGVGAPSSAEEQSIASLPTVFRPAPASEAASAAARAMPPAGRARSAAGVGASGGGVSDRVVRARSLMAAGTAVEGTIVHANAGGVGVFLPALQLQAFLPFSRMGLALRRRVLNLERDGPGGADASTATLGDEDGMIMTILAEEEAAAANTTAESVAAVAVAAVAEAGSSANTASAAATGEDAARRARRKAALAQLVGAHIVGLIQQVDTRVGRTARLVLSTVEGNRLALEAARAKAIDGLTLGQRVTATVTNLESFGAFVSVMGADALIPCAELAWTRPKHAKEVLAVGQQVSCCVVSLTAGRIVLSIRRMLPDPLLESIGSLASRPMAEGGSDSDDGNGAELPQMAAILERLAQQPRVDSARAGRRFSTPASSPGLQIFQAKSETPAAEGPSAVRSYGLVVRSGTAAQEVVVAGVQLGPEDVRAAVEAAVQGLESAGA